MKEFWSSIKGIDERYEISNYGRVRSYNDRWGRRKTPRLISSKSGTYLTVNIPDKDGIYKTHTIHGLVAATFVPNPFNLKEINHIDGDKHNNKASNLEWVSHEGNMRHASRIDLVGNRKECVCVETGEKFSSITKAGLSVGLNQRQMSNRVYKHKPVDGLHYRLLEEDK